MPTNRNRKIIELYNQGKTVEEIAKELELKESIVDKEIKYLIIEGDLNLRDCLEGKEYD